MAGPQLDAGVQRERGLFLLSVSSQLPRMMDTETNSYRVSDVLTESAVRGASSRSEGWHFCLGWGHDRGE